MTTLYHHCQHYPKDGNCRVVFYKRAFKRNILVFLFEPQQGILPSKGEKERKEKKTPPSNNSAEIWHSAIWSWEAINFTSRGSVCHVDSAFMWRFREFPCHSLPLRPATSSFICPGFWGAAERGLLWLKLSFTGAINCRDSQTRTIFGHNSPSQQPLRRLFPEALAH